MTVSVPAFLSSVRRRQARRLEQFSHRSATLFVSKFTSGPPHLPFELERGRNERRAHFIISPFPYPHPKHELLLLILEEGLGFEAGVNGKEEV